jgi:hypothetical protein
VVPVSELADVEIERVRARADSHAISVVAVGPRSLPGQARANSPGDGQATNCK